MLGREPGESSVMEVKKRQVCSKTDTALDLESGITEFKLSIRSILAVG